MAGISRGIVEYNDGSEQPCQWDIAGFSTRANVTNHARAGNTDSGKLYAKLIKTASATYQVSLYKNSNLASAHLVSRGVSTTNANTLTLVATNGSGIGGSVYMAYSADDSNIKLLVTLCEDLDLINVEHGITNYLDTAHGVTNFNAECTWGTEEVYQVLRQTRSADLPSVDLVSDTLEQLVSYAGLRWYLRTEWDGFPAIPDFSKMTEQTFRSLRDPATFFALSRIYRQFASDADPESPQRKLADRYYLMGVDRIKTCPLDFDFSSDGRAEVTRTRQRSFTLFRGD